MRYVRYARYTRYGMVREVREVREVRKGAELIYRDIKAPAAELSAQILACRGLSPIMRPGKNNHILFASTDERKRPRPSFTRFHPPYP